MTPSASAASVPMRMGMCQSARWAVRLRRGSMTITCTPVLRASSTFAHRCTLVAIRSAPQETIRSDWVTDSGSAPPTGPDGEVPGRLAAGVAHGPGLQAAGAQRMEQAVDQAAVDLPLVRAVGVAEQRQRARLGHDRLPARDDLVERLVPADRRELALALGADAAQRRRQALGRMHQLVVAVDLGAGKAGGERIGVIALDADHAAVLDLGQHRAHVGAVVGAHDAYGLQLGPPWRAGGQAAPYDSVSAPERASAGVHSLT